MARTQRVPVNGPYAGRDWAHRGRGLDTAALERLATFPQENPNPVAEADPDGRLTYVNPAGLRLAGELGGGDIRDLLPDNHGDIVHSCLHSGGSARDEHVQIHDRVLSWSYHPVAATSRLHIYGKDVTDRVRSEREVRQSREQMAEVLEGLPNGVCLLDGRCVPILQNPPARAYLDLLAEVSEDGRILKLGGLAIQEVLTARGDGLPHEVATGTSGTRTFEVEARPIRARENAPENAAGWAIVLREVTADREQEERIRRQSNLAAVGQLAAGIAHDFNNMLTVVTGNAQLLEMDPALEPKVRDALRDIYLQGQRGAQLVRQILDSSRKTVVERHSLNVIPVLKELEKLLSRTLPENITVRLTSDCEACFVESNPIQIEQIIMNLALNARDAMAGGGNLDITVSKQVAAPGEPRVLPHLKPGRWVVLEVTDTGEGIPTGIRERIFEPFFTTKDPGKGTGLGLAQIYGIVKQHGGEIDVKSCVGKGTTFTICLPEVEESGVEREDQTAGAGRGNGETILVVEDQTDVLLVVREC